MKKSVSILILLLMAHIYLNAQQGSVLIYGNIQLQKFTGVADVHDFTYTQGIGYQFSPRMTVGAEGTYSSLELGFQKTKVYRIGPFVRYALPINDLFSVYGQLGGGYIKRKAGIDETGYYFNFFPAIFLKVYRGFGLNFSTGEFTFSRLGELNEFRLNFGLIPTVGISVNIGGKRSAE